MYSGKKLQALSENLLAVTKMEGNLLSLSEVIFDLGLSIPDIIKDIEFELKRIRHIFSQHNKKIRFELIGCDRKYMIHADKYRITQVITNLIDNAINFIIDKDGLASILLEKKIENDKNYVITNIKDNGKGIHAEIILCLFTKFVTKSFCGTRLGLYTCKEIIELHHGKIWGNNNKDKKGATFSFMLPITN